mmetsp:Transcript_5145/g.13144  ORF Transcript_5145/g.13144 Transcript_5145/m.13144 type:complete len:201 (+) Transcript_5145:432-1034(+)
MRPHSCLVRLVKLHLQHLQARQDAMRPHSVFRAAHQAASSFHAFLLDDVEFLTVELVNCPRHKLLSGGQTSIHCRPRLDDGIDTNNSLESREPSFLCLFFKGRENFFLHLRVGAELRYFRERNANFLCCLDQHAFLALRNADCAVELESSIGADTTGLHVHVRRVVIRSVHTLECHIFATLEFHQVLLSIDDLQGTSWCQ